jgi:hypothetical protein
MARQKKQPAKIPVEHTHVGVQIPTFAKIDDTRKQTGIPATIIVDKAIDLFRKSIGLDVKVAPKAKGVASAA